MASFERRGNRVRAIISFSDGRKQATFDTLSEARAWAAQIEQSKTLGLVTRSKTRTVEHLITDYLPQAQQTDSGKWNELRLLNLCKDPLAKVILDNITPHDINQWSSRRLQSVKATTVNRELNLIRGMFTYGIKVRKWLKENPCTDALKPQAGERRNRRLLSPAEIEAIAIATGYRNDPQLISKSARVGACFLLAMETAMRSGEILRLRPQDYDRQARVIYVHALEKGGRKGSKSGRIKASRWVPLTNRAIELLDQLLVSMPADQTPQPDLTMPPYIVGLTDRQRDTLWRQARNRSGVQDLHFHDLKHEAATRMAQYIDIIALSHTIGTKDLKLIRDTYYNNDASRIAQSLPASLSPPQLPSTRHPISSGTATLTNYVLETHRPAPRSQSSTPGPSKEPIMDEPLSKLIRVRLTSRQYQRLSEAAALSGQNLSDYIRQHLATSQHLTEELSLLRQAITELGLLTQTHRAATETVLLTRALARPEQIAIAHASLRRSHLEPWSA